MLSTINGIDLLLVIIITGLIIWNRNLNLECESYVGQILQMSWDKQAEYDKQNPPFGLDYGYCDFCTEAKPVELYPECTCAPF